ncbi:MAG: cytochrome-c oxidase [Verrucomicrobiaceae bacterium]|nr:cytochrome-c oxidase [Verrucomicrobiaceae bacterium]|tara:strand:- start:1490 stop:1798 length:309 start_codon:yes stop_codon:yes gene_type:complete
MADSPEEIQKHLKLYWRIGYILLFCTALTVGVTYIPVIGDNIWLGLGIAAFKASLVALIFMHLNHEKPLIYKVLLYTVFFAIGMLFLTLLAMYDPIISPFNR